MPRIHSRPNLRWMLRVVHQHFFSHRICLLNRRITWRHNKVSWWVIYVHLLWFGCRWSLWNIALMFALSLLKVVILFENRITCFCFVSHRWWFDIAPNVKRCFWLLVFFFLLLLRLGNGHWEWSVWTSYNYCWGNIVLDYVQRLRVLVFKTAETLVKKRSRFRVSMVICRMYSFLLLIVFLFRIQFSFLFCYICLMKLLIELWSSLNNGMRCIQ